MKQLSAILLLALVLAACGNKQEETNKYDETSFNSDVQEMKSSGEISEEDAETLERKVEKAKEEGEDLADKTYEELLEEARREKTDLKRAQREDEGGLKKATRVASKKLSDAEQRMLMEKAARFSSLVDVTLLSKEKQKKFNEDVVTSTYVVKNKSEKTIQSVYGTMYHYKANGDILTTIDISTEKPIQSGDMFNWTIDKEFRSSDTGLNEYANLGKESFKSLWVPSKIKFSDGSTVE